MKLTKTAIDRLECPPGRRDVLVFDDEIPGFGVRVTETGSKVFILQYQIGGRAGRRTRLVLGRMGEITPAAAREAAITARAQLRLGHDPAATRRATAEAARQATRAETLTLGVLVERWARLGLADRADSHRREAQRAIRSCFADLIDRPAARITPAEAQDAVDGVAESHPVMARRARDYARACLNWGVRRRLVAANPFEAIVIEARETARDRVLSDAELSEAWHAAAALGAPFGPIFRLLILTLQRRGKVAGMCWGELASDLAEWTIPAGRAKNSRAHVVDLPPAAQAIIAAQPRGAAAELVLPSRVARPPSRRQAEPAPIAVSGFSDALARWRAAILQHRAAQAAKAGRALTVDEQRAPTWRPHDLRRTGVTVLARLGFPPHVADRLLNHVAGTIRGVAATYQRHEFAAERAAALQAWADYVADLTKE